MKVTIEKSKPSGVVYAPPSKSFSHRFIIGAALSCGESTIENVCLSEDILATIDCAKSLGAVIRYDALKKAPQTIYINGIGNTPHAERRGALENRANQNAQSLIFSCKESGSTLRFFLPLALRETNFNKQRTAIFRCAPRLIERGISVYEEIFSDASHSFDIEKSITETEGTIRVIGKLIPKKYVVKGNVSSQFITGLLFALPLLQGDSEIEILPPIESTSYLNVTLEALSRFGIRVEKTAENSYKIFGNQTFRAGNFRIEGDYSNAAFFLSFNALGASVQVEGLNDVSTQGDKICIPLFEQLKKGYTEADLSDCPDLAPVLFAVAAAKHGARFTGTSRLKLKESDRAQAMREELEKFGVTALVEENEVKITTADCKLHAPNTLLSSHNDHRIAMALSILCSITGGTIDGAEAVKKSFPDFYRVLSSIGISLKLFP